jgi:hypothetical protein
MVNFKLADGYCNLMFLRRSDGSLFCGLESQAVYYGLTSTTNRAPRKTSKL